MASKYDSLIDEAVESTPPAESKYDALIEEETSSTPLHNSLFNASGVNPDEEARKQQLAKELDTPVGILPADAEEQAKLKRVNADGLKQNTPATAKFLTNEDNAKLTGLDGVDGLAKMEAAYKTYNPENIKTFIKNYTAAGKSEGEAAQRLTQMKKQGINLADELDPYAREKADIVKDPLKAAAAGSNIMVAGAIELGKQVGIIPRLVDLIFPSYGKMRRDVNASIQQQLNENAEYWQGEKSPAIQKLTKEFEQAGITDSVSMMIRHPQLTADLLATSSPYLVTGAIAAKGGEGAMLVYNTLAEAGDAANTARQEAIAAGATPEQQDQAATRAAITTAPLAFLGNKLTGVGKLEAEFFTKGSIGDTLLKAVVKEAISGSIEEGANKFGTNVGAAVYDDNRQLLEGVGKAAVIGGILESTHVVGMSVAERALRTFVKDIDQVATNKAEADTLAAQATSAHDTLETLGAQVAENDLRTRSPEAFKEFVETMTDEQELQDVYIDGKTMLAAIETDIVALKQQIPEVVARIEEAADLGNDVQLAVSDYLTYIAGTPLEPTVLEALKAEPSGATYKEAQEFYKSQADLFQAEIGAVAEANEEVLSRDEFVALNQQESLTDTKSKEIDRVENLQKEAYRKGSQILNDETLTPEEREKQSAPYLDESDKLKQDIKKLYDDFKAYVDRPTTYEEYIAQHKNKREVYARDVQTVEDSLYAQFAEAKRFTPSVNRAYVAPLVEFYKTQAKKLGIQPSELLQQYPLKIQAFLNLTTGFELNQQRNATVSDFMPENLPDLLDNDNWVIMTPENPNKQSTPELNPELMTKFIEQLDTAGIQYLPVDGQYGSPEKSVILFNVTPEQGLALGQLWNQESVLTKDGLIYQDGSRERATGITVHKTPPADYYTTVKLPDGRSATFTVDINSDERIPAGQVSPIDQSKIGAKDPTQTEAFKNWFGDSKVVDAEGKPLVVYHGTDADFNTFNKNSFFSPSKDFAEEYGNTRQFYLSVKNPFDSQYYDHLKKLFDKVGPITDNYDGETFNTADDFIESDAYNSDTWEIFEPYKEQIKSLGYDGMVISEGGQNNYLVFEPTQIKSAIGNNGNFDANNPNILFQGGKVGQVAIKGVHYSPSRHNVLNGSFYGRGAKGAEADRVRASKDGRIKSRLYFYVDEGKGVFPEYGVGNTPHTVTMTNMYDAARNPQGFPKRDPADPYNADGFNLFESAVLDAGFDGYYVENGFGRQGAAVMLGDPARSVVPDGTAEVNQSIYYSALTRAVSELKQGKASAAQWKGMIKNLPGIKQDEVEAVGLNEWLDLQTGSVTKEALMNYLDANGVEVTEVELGAEPTYLDTMQEAEFDDLSYRYRADPDSLSQEEYERLMYLENVGGENPTGNNPTQYQNYVVGGVDAGSNYREILLTLPNLKVQKLKEKVAELSAQLNNDIPNEEYNLIWEERNELNRQLRETDTGTYKSSHFKGVQNILAHVRVDERQDPDGKRVLFVNEIQSDWAQEGKKKGFKETYTLSEIEPLDASSNEADDPDRFWYFKVPGNTLQILKKTYPTQEEAIAYVQTKEKRADAVPTGPFVGKTDAWVGLAIKRIMRYAADQGFDKVAIINGQQAADLYDLSKQVDEISFTVVNPARLNNGVNVYDINPIQNGVGMQAQNDKFSAVPENKLEDLVGKEVAKKIIEKSATSRVGSIKGNDLKVGGEGMKTFYDQIVPKVAKDILKKLGGQVDVTQVYDFDENQPKYNIVAPDGTILNRVERQVDVETSLEFYPDARVEEYKGDVMEQLGFVITPELKAKIQSGLPLFQGTRGSFNLETLTMTMLQGADLSTVIHESGHFYLKMLETLAARVDAPQEVKADYQKTLDWFGVSDMQWRSMGIEQQRPYHEQWAESFERWNLEGKAPTQALQPIFSRFRAWLLSVYKSIDEFIRLNPGAGKLNDEVRGVFSRLLAAQDAITATEAARAYQPLYTTAAEAGVSEEAFQNYINLGQDATQDAQDELQSRSLRDMKWLTNARNRALKELQATAKAVRAKTLIEVTDEVTSEPIYQAMRFLRTGETKDPNTGEMVKAMQGYKLDTDIVKSMYPSTALDNPDMTKLRGMTSTNGLDPELVARMFGLPSGDALVREIANAENLRDKIEGLTDQRMLEEHGDLVDEKSVQRAADEAVHNEARAKFTATGLKMLTKSPISVTQMTKAAKQAAENVIANKRVRDVKPKQFLAAETRANKEVMKLVATKPTEAAEQQRVALLNNRLASAAHDAVNEVDKALRYLGKFNNEGTRKSLDLEYLEQIDSLLEPFDLRKGLSLSTIDARTTLTEWVAQQEEMGFEPTIDPTTVAEAKQKSYKNMTMAELRAMVDTIKQIEHMGRMKKKLLTALERADFLERINEVKASIALNANRVVAEKGTPSDALGILGQWGRQMFAAHRKFASYVWELDGAKYGALYEILIRPMVTAGSTETEMKAQAADTLAKLFEPIQKKISSFANIHARRRVVPGTNISMTTEQRIMFAMNWGNEGNRQRLLDGGITGKKAMSEQEARAVLDTLDKEDWDFVQGVLDFIATYKPMIEAQERQLTGKAPEWIEAAPIETKFGTYPGGYFPAKYDAVLSTRSEALEAATDLRSAMKGAFGSAAARNGYTKKRATEVKGRPLLLNFNAITRHTNEVIHRLAWQSWLVDANRVVRALDSDFRTHLGAEAKGAIDAAIRDIAQGDAPASGPTEVAINRIRTGTSITAMGWSISTAMLQLTGYATSFARIGGRHMSRGLARYLTSPIETAAWVEEHSTPMRNRGRTMNREMNEILNTVRGGKKINMVTGSFFYLVGKLQRTVDIPTYIGAYEKALEEMSYETADSNEARERIEKRAHDIAAQTVIAVQGGGELKDLAAAQRGSPIYKLFTNFYSYMSMVYNMNVEAYRTTDFKSPMEVAAYTAEMILINFVPVALSVALKNALKGNCDWDDTECLIDRYRSEQVSHLFGQMVLLREVGSAVDVGTGGQGFGYSGPAGVRFFADAYKSAEQLKQGEVDMAAFKAWNNMAGALFHYPAGQINKTLEGAIAIENGEVEGAAILPALIAGAPK